MQYAQTPAGAPAAIDWDKLRIFHAVAEAGSFTRAGDVLRLSQSAVSRQISSLEEILGTSLFRRHARGLDLTEQGQILYRTAHDVFTRVTSVQALLREVAERPAGSLRVTTTVGLGSTWLTPRIRDFIERYPDISLTLVVDDRELDLSTGEADLAIRMSPPRHPDLIQRHLMSVHYRLYAAPAYVEQHGVPETLEELTEHRYVGFAESVAPLAYDSNWPLTRLRNAGTNLVPNFSVNSVYGIFRAVESGLGIGSLPDYLTGSMPDLVRVLPEFEGPTLETWLVYPESMRNSKRVAVFRDFLISQIRAMPF